MEDGANHGPRTRGLLAQRHRLMNLHQHLGISYREMAKRSQTMTDRPDLQFTHQAISKWFTGKSVPSEKGREFLSLVFKMTRDDIDREFGIDRRPANSNGTPMIVEVLDGNGNPHKYDVNLRANVDLSRTSLLHNWTNLFEENSRGLSRHFKSLSNRLCGYTPEAMRPYINHPRSVILVETDHKSFDKIESPDKRLWFSFAPDGALELGLLFLDSTERQLISAKPGQKPSDWKRYHRDQIDRVGYVGHRLLFHLKPPAPGLVHP